MPNKTSCSTIPRSPARAEAPLWRRWRRPATAGLFLAALLALAAGPALALRIKCWVNDEGVRECGQAVPPEYAQGRIEILNERGVVIEVQPPAKTPEEAAREAELARKRREAEERDRLLLRAYPTERDLLIARDNRLEAIQSIIDLTHSNTRSLQRQLEELEARAAGYERAGKKIPAPLLDDIRRVRIQMDNNRQFIATKEHEKKEVEQQFAADLARLRELTRRRPRQAKKPAGDP